MRREDALSSGTNRGLIAEGGRGAVEEVCDGAFTEEKPSCSLAEKSNLVTERLTDRSWRVRRVRRVAASVALYTRESATERRFIDQQSNYEWRTDSHIDLSRRGT